MMTPTPEITEEYGFRVPQYRHDDRLFISSEDHFKMVGELREQLKKGVLPESAQEVVPEISTASVLEEALRVTAGDRRRDYDHALPNHERIASLWNAYLGIRKDQSRVSAADVAAMMILLKLARQARTPKRDNLVDIAGYARCISQIEGMEP